MRPGKLHAIHRYETGLPMAPGARNLVLQLLGLPEIVTVQKGQEFTSGLADTGVS